MWWLSRHHKGKIKLGDEKNTEKGGTAGGSREGEGENEPEGVSYTLLLGILDPAVPEIHTVALFAYVRLNWGFVSCNQEALKIHVLNVRWLVVLEVSFGSTFPTSLYVSQRQGWG